MAIKLNIERTYDPMCWPFFRQMLQELDFGDRRIDWIMNYVEGPSFAILINGSPMEFFFSSIALCQDCPLSLYLFILYADALSRALHATIQGRTCSCVGLPLVPYLSHTLFLQMIAFLLGTPRSKMWSALPLLSGPTTGHRASWKILRNLRSSLARK